VLLIYLPVHLVIIPELILITQCINSPDPGSVKFDPSVYTDTGLAGKFGSFPSIDGSAAGQAAFGGAAPGGGLSWGAVQGLNNLANMGIQAFGDQQGTTSRSRLS
jgi:hypothetical protein